MEKEIKNTDEKSILLNINAIDYYKMEIETVISDGVEYSIVSICEPYVIIYPNVFPKNIISLNIICGLYTKINENVLPQIKIASFNYYSHIFTNNTFQEGLENLYLREYTGDINKCVFPKSLKKITIDYFWNKQFDFQITEDLFINNFSLESLLLLNVPPNNINQNLYSTDTCDVYINNVLRAKKYTIDCIYNKIIYILNLNNKYNNDLTNREIKSFENKTTIINKLEAIKSLFKK